MSKNLRKCPACGATVEGRPNKIFCNGVCKGRHFRETAAAEPQSEVPDSPEHIQAAYVPQPPAPTFAADWAGLTKASLDKVQASALHGRFCALVREMLESAGKLLTDRHLQNMLKEAVSLSAAYAAHPYIKASHTRAGDRLSALYDMQDTLQDAANEVANKEEGEGEETDLYMPKKWRNQLRELLIED